MSRDAVTVRIELGERAYPVHIGAGLIESSATFAPHTGGRTAVVVTNDAVAPLFLDSLRGALAAAETHVIVLPDGEAHKTRETLARIHDEMVDKRCARDAVVVALGGGVVGDVTGFAAATYQRGVDFVQVPTTLLAQVDSSVGGKTAVNHPRAKNMIGAFHQPVAVVADTDTLATLPGRELSAGLAEIVKYGLIGGHGDKGAFFAWLEDNAGALMARDNAALIYAIEQSCRHKAAVVAQDEREHGVRALLNLGHTFGHAIESGLGFGAWLHGEAVAAGLAMAADLSRRLGTANTGDVARIEALLSRFELPTGRPGQLAPEKMLELMGHDKKVRGGRLRLVLIDGIGSARVTGEFDPAALDACLRAASVTR